jgi:hypothetical protein
MDPAIPFYSALTSVSFTLLGIWFAVMQFGHGEWRDNRHRSTLHIALHFFLPGLAGMVALLAGNVAGGLIWRMAFLVVGIVGVVESIGFLGAPDAPRAAVGRFLAVLGVPVYAIVAAGTFVRQDQLALTPLQLEGLANALLFVIGMCLVWLAFAERRSAMQAGGTTG